ncbi:hypothetical protein Ciccas_010224 [Cichlidogyrus casuarinus]|uniref:Ig-like domain-containing protein n=1 Tax=Cichlidogyrus casuarinus TaxID=1844966 RepID=A0ABD2PVB6_9PLAT
MNVTDKAVSVSKGQRDNFRLSCIARSGYPPPKFEWRINGGLHPDSKSAVYPHAICTCVVRYSTNLNDPEESQLTMPTVELKNEDRITCSVMNEAIEYKNYSRLPYSVSVRINIIGESHSQSISLEFLFLCKIRQPNAFDRMQFSL